MKYYSFEGPGGEVKAKPPIVVWAAESNTFLLSFTLVFVALVGYFIVFTDHTGLIGRKLMPAHQKLTKNCTACHVPFVGAPDQACMSAECHPKTMNDTIHNSRRKHCVECHPEHTDGAFPPEAITNQGCAECHGRLKADPQSQFYPAKWDQREVTNVPRTIFRHRQHQYPPHYKCWQCHCTGKGTLDLATDQLFVMDSCMKCHVKENCKVCHPYHQKREPRPRVTKCIGQEFVQELQFKTLECTPYKGREPGYNNMTVCETGQSAAYQPAAAEGGTATPPPTAPSPPAALPPPGP